MKFTSAELYGANSGEPQVVVDSGVKLLVPDFEPDVVAHANLLSACGMDSRQIEDLQVTYRSFSDAVLESLRSSATLSDCAIDSLSTGGEFSYTNGNPEIVVYVGHGFEFTEDDNGVVDMGLVNEIALHETGHYVLSQQKGLKKTDLRIRAAARTSIVGAQMFEVAQGMLSVDALYFLHPVYFSHPVSSALAYVGLSVFGGSVARIAQSAADGVCYRSSPQEKYARQFQVENAKHMLVRGTPSEVGIGNVLLRCAQVA